MSEEQWKRDYEAAFLAANLHAVTVVEIGGGWYRLSHAFSGMARYRKSQILEMTARLEKRVADRGGEQK